MLSYMARVDLAAEALAFHQQEMVAIRVVAVEAAARELSIHFLRPIYRVV